MIEALNMQLESIRTVLKNEVNEISVCIDLRRRTGVFYTLISITSASVRRQLATLIAAEGLFATNRDFIGSFSYGDSLNLLFCYRQENLLSRREAIYATSFVHRKRMAESMLVALAEIQITNSVGLLLLDERTLNISSDASIYFNYFLDFSRWDPQTEENAFFTQTAQLCFEILSREYQARYDGFLPNYPSELQVLFKKTHLGSFTSFNSILTFIKMIPDAPREPSVGWRRLADRIRLLVGWVRRNAMAIFLVSIVLVTIGYTVCQVTVRLSYRSAAAKSTVYNGMETVGEVYLGDENV